MNSKLTNIEKEVLHLYTEEFLTIKQMAQRRGVTIYAIYKVLRNLKKKGQFDTGLNKVKKIEPTYLPTDIRLHAQEFNIRILWQDNKYQQLLEKSNTLFIDSNTIRLYKNSIEIYSGQNFYGKSGGEAERKSLEYWNRFLTRLEHDLDVSLIKPRARNIKIVNQHWARGNSEISYNAKQYRQRVWVYAEEDGKLCFITDDSFGFMEDEALHPITAKHDRKAIDKQINDWRLNNPPTQSELAISVSRVLNELPPVLSELKTQISSHLSLIQEYRKENIEWREMTKKRLKEEVKFGKQTKLKEWL